MYSLQEVAQGLAEGRHSVTCIERMDEKQEVSEAGERMRRLVCEDLAKSNTHTGGNRRICTEGGS